MLICAYCCFLIFRKRNRFSEIIRHRGEERRREVHENGQAGHRFQVGEIRFQN